ncbi:hypothetical protein EYF80_001280 [Liparis tanakae]|uniref:Uncharacterized protein n=1 Tax=Liparis tanakae TaxID=230148 RepID=A0A4Z2JEV5_9TELE|nr:hypothetical protein EYF80_001280 [Liparis tanakae]
MVGRISVGTKGDIDHKGCSVLDSQLKPDVMKSLDIRLLTIVVLRLHDSTPTDACRHLTAVFLTVCLRSARHIGSSNLKTSPHTTSEAMAPGSPC